MFRVGVPAVLMALVLAPSAFAQNQLDDRYKEKLRQDQRLHQQSQERRDVQRKSANASFIGCPVNKLRTEVVTDLPRGWWQTPQVGGLEDTRVQTIGGQRTLVCAYRGYGGTVSVMREEPRGKRCRPRSDGFSCY